MEASTVEQEQVEQEIPEEEAARTPEQLFRFSTWVHVGPGAEECEAVDEDKGTVECSNPAHFHAWCRLPNQFQHREIREKALAARARRKRQLRDPESDASAVLEEDLDELLAAGDAVKPDLVSELLQQKWLHEYIQAQQDVAEDEHEDQADGEEPTKRWEHIRDDIKRLDELHALPADERPQDEYDSLTRHVAAYHERVEEAYEERAKPERDALNALDLPALIEKIRARRIDADAHEVFMQTYAEWQTLVGTLAHLKGPMIFVAIRRVKETPAAGLVLTEAAPEVIDGLKEAFNDMERSFGEAASGNS